MSGNSRIRFTVFFRRSQVENHTFILGSQLWDEFIRYGEETDRQDLLDSLFAKTIKKSQEAAIRQYAWSNLENDLRTFGFEPGWRIT